MTNRSSIPTEIEREILIECGHRCAVCGAPFPLERAHIIPWHKSREHKAEDLICLCASCHERTDNEKWGEKTLREYKRRPWVMRQYEREDSISNITTTKVTLTIEAIPYFDETSQRLLPFAIAALVDTSPNLVRIVSIKKGSVKITIELPTESAKALLTAYEQKDPELYKYLSPFVLLDLHQEIEKHEKVLNNYDNSISDSHLDSRSLKVFISYKWEDETRDKWVEKFATDLRNEEGIEAILDKWEVRFGDSFTDYMTSKINEANAVLFIMTTASVAAVEAPKENGGAVKFEMQMAIARRTAGERMRLIGIYREGDKALAHLRDHRYADFRDDSKYKESLRELVDDLLDRTPVPSIHSQSTVNRIYDPVVILSPVSPYGVLGIAQILARNCNFYKIERDILEKSAKIREQYPEATYDIVANRLKNQKEIVKFGLDGYENHVLECVARIAGICQIDDIKADSYNDIKGIRIRFLAALMLLANQLDIYSGNIDVQKLKENQSISIEEKLNRWLRSYVTEVNIDNGKIKICYGIPKDQAELYGRIVKKLVSGPIWKLYNDLADILWDYGVQIRYSPSEIREFSIAESMPPDLWDYAKKKTSMKFVSENEILGQLGEYGSEIEIPMMKPYYYTATKLPLRFKWEPFLEAENYEVLVLTSQKEKIWSKVVSGCTDVYYPETAPMLRFGERYKWRIDAMQGGEFLGSRYGVFWLIYDEDSSRQKQQSGAKSDDDIFCLAQTYSHIGIYEEAINMYKDIISRTNDVLLRMEAYRGLARIYTKMSNGLHEMEYRKIGDLFLRKAAEIMDIIKNTDVVQMEGRS